MFSLTEVTAVGSFPNLTFIEGPSSEYSYAAAPNLHKPAVKTAVQHFGVVVSAGMNHSVSMLSDFPAAIDIEPDVWI